MLTLGNLQGGGGGTGGFLAKFVERKARRKLLFPQNRRRLTAPSYMRFR